MEDEAEYIQVTSLLGYALVNDISHWSEPFGPIEPCSRCKLHPTLHGENDICMSCTEADHTEWRRKLAARREQSRLARIHLNRAARALKRMAAVSDSHERESLTNDASHCTGTAITLGYWAQDYRGGRSY